MDTQRLDAELAALWEGLREELDDQPVRGRRVALAVVATAGMTVAVCGAAAAHVFLYQDARTGEAPTGQEVKISGTGEWLEESAANMPEVIRDLTTDIPFAPGYRAYQQYTYSVEMTSTYQGRVTTSAARATVANQAICSWVDAWVAADRSGNHKLRAEAERTVEEAPHWNAVTALMPFDPSAFVHLSLIIPAMRSGDPDAVARSLFEQGGTYCSITQLKAIDGPRLLRESGR